MREEIRVAMFRLLAAAAICMIGYGLGYQDGLEDNARLQAKEAWQNGFETGVLVSEGERSPADHSRFRIIRERP